MFRYVVSLAGGKGTRLGKLTAFTPKALVEVDGSPLISYSLNQINNIDNKIITIGDSFEQLANYVKNFDVFTIINTRNKGNCWWISNSFLKLVNEPVLVLTCDLITKIDIDFLYSQYVKIGCPAIMLVPTKPMYQFEGDFLISYKNHVTGLSRDKKTDLFCTGIQVLNPSEILKIIGKKNLPEDFSVLWKMLIEKKGVYHSELYPYPWYSINTEFELRLYEKISSSI